MLVDEYQDTNRAQSADPGAAELHRNLCVVGDDDQSDLQVARRGSRNILDFEADFPGAGSCLEQNYRSSERILAAPSAVIASNGARKQKRLWTHNADGEPAPVKCAWDEHDEARPSPRPSAGCAGTG